MPIRIKLLLILVSILIVAVILLEPILTMFGVSEAIISEISDWLHLIGSSTVGVAVIIEFSMWFFTKASVNDLIPAIFENKASKKLKEDLLKSYYQKIYTPSKSPNSLLQAIPCRATGDDPKSSEPLIDLVAKPQFRKVIILGDSEVAKHQFMDNLVARISGSHLDKPYREEFNGFPLVKLHLSSLISSYQKQGFEDDFLATAIQDQVQGLMGEKGSEVWEILEKQIYMRGVVLLEGLDEVLAQKDMREEVLDAIDELSAQLGPTARLIITSRADAFEEEEWLEGLACLQLDDI